MFGAFIRFLVVLGAFAGASARAAESEPLSVDVTYEIGAGDTIRLDVLGVLDMSGTFPVAVDGSIEIPSAGRVAVAGFTVAAAKEQVEARLRDGYVREPQVVLAVVQITSKILKVTGGVVTPGEYPMTAAHMRVSDILVRSGGLVDPSTPRAELWRVVGGARTVIAVDLERVSKGESASDVEVLPGDTLVVPPPQQIFVDGCVQKPGSYVFHDGMTLSTAVAAAGGANGTALTAKVKLIRGEEQVIINLRKILKGQVSDVALKPGDHVYIPESAI
ncbi:hypothetical protein LBMAG42_04320 [Deltaproteobacteria bacterium]|nr:hypothetical protein LBMAG42_04320 [Deltaproteobacteria bacterium]